MINIHRHEVKVDEKVHQINLTSDPHGVGLRVRGVVEFWTLHNDDAGEQERFFTVTGTGYQLPKNVVKVWGYAYDLGGTAVWHLVEVSS